ncbi:hypothetical protein KDW_38440 [Dictyobacter vulcani]|uniref:Uncharacterized protein n=1 Tax=Dictyobacter vulcani TaxID=2607529 RepID=A0A5J4KRF7_9CHLR|nr:hypothetical protein [Dictyobacter vulcani]GER89682.1 hypothetical protein KDW_38440 [Dictyobacter vulcani]
MGTEKKSPAREKFDARPMPLMGVRTTLEHVRRHLYDIDILRDAERAGITPSVIYSALMMQPIDKTDAEKILKWLSKKHEIAPELTLADVDIPIYDDFMILHIICASGQDVENDYQLVYARDTNHARVLLKKWIEPLSYTHPNITISEQKSGVVIFGGPRIPGYISPKTN